MKEWKKIAIFIAALSCFAIGCDDSENTKPTAVCGDGVVTQGEQCDDGAKNGTDGSNCTTDCKTKHSVTKTECGNGVKEEGEACDDGKKNGSDASSCSADCTLKSHVKAECGNGVKEEGEACDDGKKNGSKHSSCTENCKVKVSALCGNNVLDKDEKCDFVDNVAQFNGSEGKCAAGTQGYVLCTGSCEINASNCSNTCGDGKINAPEVCDDGKDNGKYGKCSDDCSYIISCGDDFLQSEREECDDNHFPKDSTECSDYSSDYVQGKGRVKCGNDCKLDYSQCTPKDKTKCGNNKLDENELCDGNLFFENIKTCKEYSSAEYASGNLKCKNCDLDESACVAVTPVCGNGVREGSEICDGKDFKDKMTCRKLNPKYTGGTLRCTDACGLDDTLCTPRHVCGNNVLEEQEECDQTRFANQSDECVAYDPNVYKSGKLSCTKTCKVNTTQCVKKSDSLCNGKKVDPGEDCDGTHFKNNKRNCSTVEPDLYKSGKVSCTNGCKYDFSDCIPKNSVCGDGIVVEPEECDGNKFYAGETTCKGYDPKNYSGGNLKCTSQCKYDFSGCTKLCGNGKVDGDEECDGNKFYADETTCKGYEPQNYSGGNLKCTPQCKYDFSGCTKLCGNGKLDPGEYCDGNTFHPQMDQCANFNGTLYKGGKLTCNTDCTPNVGACVPKVEPAVCGDGKLHEDEFCDKVGDVFRFSVYGNCTEINDKYQAGAPGCVNCQIDETPCKLKATCGDNVFAENYEYCDKVNGKDVFDGSMNTCPKVNNRYTGGTLKCNAKCEIDESGCLTKVKCGDNVFTENQEYCDIVDGVAKFDPTMSTCVKIDNKKYKDGKPDCTATCEIDESPCVLRDETAKCGDNKFTLDKEYCDIVDGVAKFDPTMSTCVKIDNKKYKDGKPDCTATCEIDESPCIKS